MDSQIHDHITSWLEASMKGRLTGSQRQALRQHLADCPACQRTACAPEWVSRAEELLARRAAVPADLESAVVEQLRAGVEDERLRVWRRRRQRLRIALRASLVVILLILLGLRSLNLRGSRQDTWTGRTLSATAQVFLREPRYDTLSGLPETLDADERRLAVAHQLIKGCVGMLLWVCVLLLCGLTFLDVWRRSCRLSQPG